MKKFLIMGLLLITVMSSFVFSEDIRIAQVANGSKIIITILRDDVIVYLEQTNRLYNNLMFAYNEKTHMLLIDLDTEKTFAIYFPVENVNVIKNIEPFGFNRYKYESEY